MIQNPGTKQVTTLFFSLAKAIRSLTLTFCLIVCCAAAAIAQPETLSTGSYIINMGVVPQTQSNALKPYGLVYDLLKNHNVQVKWVISQSKLKDGADFTYNGAEYKGGTFIIPAQYRTAAVNNRINFFGVTGITTTSPLTVNVTYTLTTAPKWTLDFQNGQIAAGFFAAAGIPAAAYDTKTPAQLNGCDEIYVMPHADADWSYYGPLRNWILNFRGSFWGGCRTGSQIENLYNPAVPSEQMNFLSTNVGAAGNALIPYGNHQDGTPPYVHQFPNTPVAQYMGITDAAHNNGSERIYLPVLNGSWRPTTRVIAYDPTHANVPSRSPGPASAIVYGRAYGNPLSGLVMYEAGHDIGGKSTQQIAAQRAFWNFSFLSSTEVLPGGCVGSISDFVWNDANGNGLQDSGETGIPGVQVTLTRPDLSTVTTTTSATGFYQFGNLVAGTYKVTFPATLAGGYALTNQNVGPDDTKDSDPDRATGLVNNIIIRPGQNNPTIDAGYVMANLTLGNKVFYDFNRSGSFDAGDGFVAGATVRLYADANNDNTPDGGLIQAQQTNAFGEYAFANLSPGNYIVGVAIPSSYAITVVNGGDPDNNIDNDNNAIIRTAGEARGNAISLASGTEPGGNINNTYDFGFYNPIAPPNGGENCFSGTNPIVYAKSYWNVNVNAQTVTMRVTFSKKFVDNTYGTNAVGWTNGHTFNNLLGSDHLQWSIRDANGIERLAFKQDYVSASAAFPSGYGCLGFGGDGGTPTVGLATDVLSFRTSIATNFNDFGYILPVNSPATDTNYTPNPAQSNWIYDVWYEVTVKASVFGTTGFGFVNVASVHASPSKTGNNTEIITNNPCASGSIGDRVWNDLNKNGLQDANEVGLAGIVISLYDGSTNKVLASTVSDGYGNYKFNNLETSVTGINYQVRFSQKPGYRFSSNNGLITVANNSDANIITGRTGTITLTNAVPNVTYVDAGMCYTETARVGDFVWNDTNKNGIQETGEPGIAGVNVMLYTNTNALYRSTITASNGLYYFNEVPAGTYYIKVSPPIGYQFSPKDAAADNVDSDIDPVTRQTPNFVVVAGTGNLTLDAGLDVTSTTGASASLGDKVWEDLNNNNVQDDGEPGIANVTVQLYSNTNVLQATAATDAFGNYIFNGLNPGSYYIKFGLPAGYNYVTANVGSNDAVDSDADGTGTSQTVALVADEINTTVDAGLRRTTAGAALGDFVWYDLNKNGVQDGGSEAGVPGVTAILYNSSNVVVATTTTNMSGFYLFTGLTAATTYAVGFENIPAGYGFSPNNGAVTVTNNSDVNPSTGRTGNVSTGAAGTTISYVDAGLIFTPKVFDSKGTVGDRVWNDLNNNGIQDAGEPGIAAVTVTLYAANGTTVVATTITDALGNYLFTNLDAGTYLVGFSSLPAGYVFATKDAGTNDEKDSDADAATGKTTAFTLAQGEINLSLDAGARNTSATVSSIGNFAWFDLNNNGLQDSGEPGAAGISVELTNMAGLVMGTTTTSATGEYRFTDLPANNYYVEFTNLPAGFTVGTKNVGADDAIDSDPNVSSSKTDIIVLPASYNDLTWDMAIVTTTRASVGDYVWNDTNMNGIQDAGETGVSGVTVTLFNNSNVAVTQTVTDANGFYLFSNVLPGTYSVGFGTIPASSAFTTQNATGSTASNNSDADQTGRTATFTLVAGQSKTDVDAGLVSLKAAVGDYVWNDTNNDGLQQANEAGVPGITVTMYTSANATIGDADDVASTSAVTDANGYYFINNVSVAAAGSQFYMRYTDVQSAYDFTLPLVGGTAASNNSKVTTQPVANGRTGFFTLSPGQVYRDMDAGILLNTASIGDRVWFDNDNDGIQDAGENGIGGVTVKLRNAANAVIATQVTNATGNYLFSNLLPGNYSVEFPVTVSGYPLAPAYVGADRNIDSDPDRTNGISPVITLVSAEANTTIDAGYAPNCDCVNSSNNLLTNGSFENGTTGWSSNGGTLTANGSNTACGAFNGVNAWTSGTSKVWQDLPSNAGTLLTFSGYAGTTTAGLSCSPKISLIFLDAVNNVISQTDIAVTRNVNITNGLLEQYTLTAVAPAGTRLVRVQSSINCNNLFIDAFCVTTPPPPPPPPLVSLGDRVWNDSNNNGIQDAGEVGIAGVTLVLLNNADVPIATTTTDAYGIYLFQGLRSGQYSVRITPPANYSLSQKLQGTDTTKDSDFDQVTYVTRKVTLVFGDYKDLDAGLYFTNALPASAGDRVWLDLNRDGVQDAGEPGVSNVLVTLYNSTVTPVRYTYTDVNGYYLFTDVTPGSYTAGVSLPPAFVFSPNNGAVSAAVNSDIIPATGKTALFTVNAGDQIRYVDAGIRTQETTNGSIGDFVWNDLNQDGLQDSGEPGIEDVAVRLINAVSNAVVANTTTDVAGKYIFNDVPAGNYLLEFVTPAAYTTTSKLNNNVETSATDSDVDPATSKTASFNLAAGQRITTVDAGYWQTSGGTAMIGDRVWLDANQNGIQDIEEKDVQGITVVLYDGTNAAIKKSVTDATGNYLFTNLAAGNYTVGFSNIPAGYTFTTPGLGTAATGSDANPVSGRTATITLTAVQTNLDVDAGIRSGMAGTASLGNRVWNDLNNNGIQDTNEPGIAGVNAELLDANGNPIDSDPVTPGSQPTTRVTNPLGEYLFTGLAAGDLKVRFSTIPTGFTASPKAAGTNRDMDSDGNAIAAGTSTTDMVSVAAGEERLDIDLGLFNPTAPTGQLGDFVWFDINNNGVQNSDEPGIPGVEVILYNILDNAIAKTVTDINGKYRFVNLSDGFYYVEFNNLPDGFFFTPQNQGNDDSIDSDPGEFSGTTALYQISEGNINLTVDGGLITTKAALGDYVWFDADSDGTQDATEKGIAGITVTLYDANNTAVTSTVTDQNGRYFFSNLNPAAYTVAFGTIPTQLVFTIKDAVVAGDLADSDVDPTTGKTGPVTLTAGQVNLTVDAGLKPSVPASIGDFVWYDLDRDGIQDPNETAVPGVSATLYNAANQVIGTAITDGNGFYQISNVPPGTDYYVLFNNKPDPNAPWTLQNVGGAGANNNSKADATGKTGSFNVAEGQNITNIDAGLFRIINLSGNVWHDANGMEDNLVNKTSIVPIPVGLRVYLVNFSNGTLVEAIKGVSSSTGTYSFPNVHMNNNYRIYLTTQVFAIGAVIPNSSFNTLPGTWTNTGEKLGITPGSDGIANGWLNVAVGISSVINANFGIKEGGGGGQQ